MLKKDSSTKKDVYQVITDRIITMLENETVPWHKPWMHNIDGQIITPINLQSGKAYRGINLFMLNCLPFESEYFLTYKQAKDRGGQVKKGETGFPVVFWQFGENEKTKDNGEKTVDKYCWCRYYTVFNVEQCDNVAYPKSPKAEELPPFNRIDNAECIYPNMPNKPLLVHKEQRAYYQPMHDMVNMPIPESFNIPEEYYSTLFHELTHSTMHPDRCGKRDENFIDKPSLNFGSQSYSKEELIAEMGASFLSGHCGFVDTTIEQSASYINGWLSRLRNDKKFIIQAAQQTQKAVDYILDRNNEETR